MKNDTSSRASALLRKASPAFEPSSADRMRTRAAIRRRIAVGIAASAAVSATTKTAAAAPSVAPAAVAGGGVVASGGVVAGGGAVAASGVGVGFATKIVAAVAIFGTVSAGAVTVHRSQSHSQANAKTSTSTSTQTEVRTMAMPKSTGTTTATGTTTETATETATETQAATPNAIAPVAGPISNLEASPSPVTHRPSTSLSTSPSTLDSRPALQIGAEVDLVRRAQEALHDGDANAALALLDEHAKKYPNGALAEEREAARILALCDAHRTEDARAAARSFSSAHPASPFATRIASSCANNGAGSIEP